MKKTNYFFAALGLLAFGLSSCSSDEPLANVPEKVEFDQKQYLAVQISAPSDQVSRTFENGATNESIVDHLDFLFYDVAGNPTAQPYPMADLKDENFKGNENGNNVTRICQGIVTVNLTQGQNLPSQVICIVNGEADAVNELKTKTLDELMDVTRTYFRNTSFFVMSNSVYYGQNVLTGNPQSRLCATPININTQLFKTEALARAAQGGAILDIYVERVAAKVGLTLDAAKISDYTLVNGDGEGEVILSFKPEYWAMNATANNNYLTKRYGVDNNGEIVMLPSYSQINDALSNAGWNNWNDEKQFRSYWGCSPSYFENTYPFVSDDVDDLEAASTEVVYPVTYYTYNGVRNQANRTDDGGIGKQALNAAADGSFSIVNTGATATGYIYTRETTVASATIHNIKEGNPAAAVASAIIVGKYTVTGATPQANGTFYIDANAGVIDESTVGTFYGSMVNARAALSARQRIVYTTAPTVGGTSERPAADVFALVHPTKAVRDEAGVKVAGRLVTLQITNLPADPIYYFDVNAEVQGSTDKGGYVQVTEKNLVDVNAQLLTVGYMDMYNAGHAFFSVPVHHLNWTNETCLVASTAGEGEETTYGPAYNWEAIPVGALGVVRNHVYTINVSGISGLAAGLRSDDQPIVPAKDEYNQYIKANINILSWNVVPTQDVAL